MNLAFLTELHVHMEWADALVWRAALDADPQSTDALLFDTLSHLHFTQHAFLAAWQGKSVDWKTVKKIEGLPDLRAWSMGFYAPGRKYVVSLEEGAPASSFTLPWAGHMESRLGESAAQTTLGDTLYQLAAHSTYHRGQVNRRIRELGGEPALVDYIAWVWLNRPAPDWS